jgi:ribosomal protein S4E
MSDLSKLAIEEAYSIWRRGFLLYNQKCSFETKYGTVTFESDDEKLSSTFTPKNNEEEVGMEIEINEFYIGQVVTVTRNGEHFGKQGVIKEISNEDCLVRVPDADREYFTNLYFDKEYLK